MVIPSTHDIAMLAATLQQNPVGGVLLILLFALVLVGIWLLRPLSRR
jgi:flagellar biogenesis protein FliO